MGLTALKFCQKRGFGVFPNEPAPAGTLLRTEPAGAVIRRLVSSGGNGYAVTDL
jgi:hypothetical protein